MRNPLKRRPSTDPKPTLRERFAATKAKYGRTLAVHRALNAPLPERPEALRIEPPIDAALLDALDDLNRLDAAQAAMGSIGPNERDVDTIPGYKGLEDARDDALGRLAEIRAESLIGLQAKAKALLTRSVSDMGGKQSEDIAESLARDLLGATSLTIEPQPDPIFAAIEESRRLEAAHSAIHNACSGYPDDGGPCWAGEPEAHAASWTQWRDVVLQTVPCTAEGCKALAAYAGEWFHEQGTGEDVDGPAVLALIARSPLL